MALFYFLRMLQAGMITPKSYRFSYLGVRRTNTGPVREWELLDVNDSRLAILFRDR